MRPASLIAAAGVLGVAVVVLVIVLVTRGGPAPTPTHGARTSAPHPPSPAKTRPPVRAHFELLQLPSASGSRHPKHHKIRTRARSAALRIKDVIIRVYTFGFLDRRGPASRLLSPFVGPARHLARTHPQVLTLGSRARRLRGLRQQHSTLEVRTLFSPQNHPITSLAIAKFRARGRLRGGGRLVVRSLGTFFLRPGKHGWVIYGFQVRRHDRTHKE